MCRCDWLATAESGGIGGECGDLRIVFGAMICRHSFLQYRHCISFRYGRGLLFNVTTIEYSGEIPDAIR